MKALLYIVLLSFPGLCAADTFILKDGARLEGEVTGEMDGTLLVKTKYGSLTINKSDIQERKTSQPPEAAQPAAAVPAQVSTQALPAAAPVQVSTAALPAPPQVEVSTVQPAQAGVSTAAVTEISTQAAEAWLSSAAVVAPAPKLTFRTVQQGGFSLLVYSEGGVAVATEAYSPDGALQSSEGKMADGTYTEYYDGGGLKAVRTMMAGKANGTLKAYYPSGALQAEAYYLMGGREGAFKYFTESGKPLMQAEYKNDVLNGWKRDYGPDGALAAETYFADGKPASPPGTQAATDKSAALTGAQESQVTARTVKLTRGERFEFRLNDKHIGLARLDKEYNLIELEGKLPDGAVKVYSKDGKLQKELIFKGRELTGLRVYDEGGPLRAEYVYKDNRAVKK